MIDINKYFVEIVDNGGGTIGYNVVSPGELLTEIIEQNKKLQALKEWNEANKPTGICETCTEKTLLQNDRYRNQIKLLGQEREELKKYLKEIGRNLGLNVDTGIIGEGAIEHWAVISSSINDTIKKLQNKFST